jgi:hypothetical protein
VAALKHEGDVAQRAPVEVVGVAAQQALEHVVSKEVAAAGMRGERHKAAMALLLSME